MREEGESGAKAQVGRVPAQYCRIWAGDAQGEAGSSPSGPASGQSWAWRCGLEKGECSQ